MALNARIRPGDLSPGIVILPESRTWDFVNYQIGAVYKPTASSSLYVSYATSSTPPTISAGDQNTRRRPARATLR
jgi:outer membrane receptor for monomeric catechols